MPGLTPGRRFQPAYFSFRRRSARERLLAFVERQAKGLAFGCRMCGNCLLQETAFICPMECPKGLRNGPCGGSTPEGCYVDPSRPCIWHRIYERAERMGRTDRLMEVLPPLDWSRVGAETWSEVVTKASQRGAGRALASLFTARASRQAFWDPLFAEIRQPDWWQGDDQPHPAAPHQPVSRLEEKLAAGQFVVTAEVAPPLSVAPDELIRTLQLLRDFIDAANFTDNPSATPRMSSLACSAIAVANGVEPVMQIAARDRTRMGLQAEILGAAALGIRNVLCLTGDHSNLGPAPPGRMDIWDLDAIQMLWILRRMRDDRHYLDGRTIRIPPRLFLGAAASPFASTPRIQAMRELKKSHAGAQFFQSNLVYDVDAFERYLEALDRNGTLAQSFYLVGITPVRSARAARAMAQVPGVMIPPSLVSRLERSSDAKEEGVQIALEIIERVRRLPGVAGIHIMAVGWELIVPRLVREAGLKELPAGQGSLPDGRGAGGTIGLRGLPCLVDRPKEYADRRYLDLLAEKIVVFDGAMGTSIQKHELEAADFGGERYAGCNDYLVLQKPQIIEAIHASFLEAGCDVIETCTFRANRITMAEYGLADEVPAINRAAAELARRVADRFGTAERYRFVAGSIGPSGKLPGSSDPALSDTSFADLADVFREQAEALIEGGCDLLLLETSQDMLEVKAAIMGLQHAFALTGRKIPLQVQVTLDANGRMLLGTDVAAVLASLERMPVDVLGLNCSTGPDQMREPLSYLGENSSRPVSCLPNAGLPVNVGGEAVYPLAPGDFARELSDFVERFGLNVVGGCCGTTPEHLRLLVERLAGRKPRIRTNQPLSQVSSGMTAAGLVQEPAPMLIGERLNAQGSKKMKELLLAEDMDGIAALGREQIEGGAHTLDICVAMTERRDEAYLMSRVVRTLSQTVEAPLVIDTTEADVLEAALMAAPGRVIVNAVNMENGRVRLDSMLPLIRDFGAATIALTIDELGMARTADRKLEIARKIHEIATREYGLLSDALIFDALTFTLATGDPESAHTAVETLDGIRAIKAALPGVLTSLGVSNVSYGFKPAARAVLNSVFLHHAVKVGLDMAIVNPKQITPYAEIPEIPRELAEDLLLDRRPDAAARFISFYEGTKSVSTAASDPTAGLTAAERLHWRIVHRRPEGAELDLDALMVASVETRTGIPDFTAKPDYHYPNADTTAVAVAILNDVLLPAMKEVGDRFGSGALILPFVLQSAEVMRKTVTHLERYLDKAEGLSKGRVVLATVYGDVHDIGKNLIRTILANNGYSVQDLGKQVPVNAIVDAAVEFKADAIGLSALLVSTSRQMPLVVRELDRRGLSIPVLVGGAAINRSFGREIGLVEEGRPYAGGVYYCKDAFEGLACIGKLTDQASRKDPPADEPSARPAGKPSAEPTALRPDPAGAAPHPDPTGAARPPDPTGIAATRARSTVVARCDDVPTPPFWGARTIASMPLDEVFAYLDEKKLFRLSWGAKDKRGAEWEALHRDFSARLTEMKATALRDEWFAPQAVYGYFPAWSDGNDLLILDAGDQAGDQTRDLQRHRARFSFPRQVGGDHLCLADYFLPIGSVRPDVAALQVVTVGGNASGRFDAMDSRAEYSEAYYFHGLAVQTAEAATLLTFARIQRELGLPADRGTRYAWGYGALPDVEEHRRVFSLLPAEAELGLSLTSAGQMVPEHSTAALVVHHPAARYFRA
jgi:5-methyltetrahydrofolate--homocysteine methyltransferase